MSENGKGTDGTEQNEALEIARAAIAWKDEEKGPCPPGFNWANYILAREVVRLSAPAAQEPFRCDGEGLTMRCLTQCQPCAERQRAGHQYVSDGTTPVECIRALVNQWREFGPEGFEETIEAAARRFSK